MPSGPPDLEFGKRAATETAEMVEALVPTSQTGTLWRFLKSAMTLTMSWAC